MTLIFLAVVVLLIWGRVSRLQTRLNHLEAENDRLSARLVALDARLREVLERGRVPGHADQSSRPATGAAPAAEEQPPGPHVPEPRPAPPVRPIPPLPVAPPAPPPPVTPRPVSAAGAPDRPLADAAAAAAVRHRPARPLATPAPTPPAAGSTSFDWEGLVGVKLFSWVAGIALALGAIFFLRYSIQSGWLQPPVRMAIGLLTGIGLLVGCEMRVARRYAVTANALDAAGLVILFSTIFAAHALWDLLDPLPAFALLIVVTIVAVLLSIRRNSVFVALLGLVGGFATPALLSTGQDDPLGLFGYLLLLNAGLAWVAYYKRWTVLVALSLAFTTLYQWGWVFSFLTPARLPLAAVIFLVFPVLAWVLLATKGKHPEDADRFGKLAALNAALPLLLALYLAVVPGYGERFPILFGFLFLVDVGLFAIARARGPQELHALGAASTLLVCFSWWTTGYPGMRPDAWPSVLAFVALFVVFYLAAGWAGRRRAPRFQGPAAQAVLAAPLLLFMFPALAASEPGFASPGLPFAALFLLLAAIATYAMAEAHGWVFFAGAFLAVSAEAVWTARHLAPERLPAALTIYAVFTLLYAAVPLVARRLGKTLQPEGVGASLGLTGHLFLLFVATQQPTLSVPPWPLFGVLFLLGLAIGAAALEGGPAEPHAVGLAASQFILIAWVANVPAAPWPLAAMAAAAGFAGLGLAWSGLARGTARSSLQPFDAAAAAAVLLGQVVLVFAAGSSGAPPVTLVAGFHIVFLVGALALATWSDWPVVSVLAVLPTALAAWLWKDFHPGPTAWQQTLTLATPLYLLFLAHPLALWRRVGTALEPHLAAVLASAVFFFVARDSLVAGGFGHVIGLLPLVQAALAAVLLAGLLRIEPAGARTLGRLALVAGTVLAFVTMAIPLQLENEWLTIGWALEGAALAWLFTRIPHRGLFWWALGLLAVVFVRLALNPEVFVYREREALRIFNWYLYTYATAAGSMLLASRWLSRGDDRVADLLPRGSTVLSAGGTALLFLLLNIEIADFWATGPYIEMRFSAGLAQDLTYTLGWAVFAVALLTVGIIVRSQPARLSAILLLTVTVLKGFLYDMARLGGLYRVMSFVGLAICLALVAVVLQRFVLSARVGRGG